MCKIAPRFVLCRWVSMAYAILFFYAYAMRPIQLWNERGRTDITSFPDEIPTMNVDCLLHGHRALSRTQRCLHACRLPSGRRLSLTTQIGAVVVGVDPHISYYKLCYASLCLLQNPGCLFVASNTDSRGHFMPHQEWPGAGSAVGEQAARL